MSNKNKIKLHMHLPQTMHLIGDNLRLYELFIKRSTKKNTDKHAKESRNPVQLILNINHEMYDTQAAGVVINNSLLPIVKDNEVIGFTLEVENPMNRKIYELTVLKIGKAYLEEKTKLVSSYPLGKNGPIKTLIHMHLPQTHHFIGNTKKLYELFKNRCETKSKHKHIEESKNPIQMILHINNDDYDTQASPTVVYNSFKTIENHDGEEIGFTLEVEDPMDSKIDVLTVFKIGKAFLEDKEELEAYLEQKKNKT